MAAITIPFDSNSNILVVTVRGSLDAEENAPKGWRHVVENFYYECQANDGINCKRSASRFLAFYRSHSPQAITHWGIISKITEKDGIRRYHIDSLIKLGNYIPFRTIPPMFSGGGITIPLEIFFKIRNTDELYEKYRTESIQ